MGRILTRMVLIGIALAVVGCGKSSPKDAFEKLVEAAKSGDENGMLACMDKVTSDALKVVLADSKKRGETHGFVEGLKTMEFTCGEEKINGDKATMDVTGGGNTVPIEFVKEDGVWKVSVPVLVIVAKSIRQMEKLGVE